MAGTRPWIVAAVFAADQLSKWLLIEVAGFTPKSELAVAKFLNIVMVWNRGISFGMLDQFGELGRWILVFLTLGVAVVLGIWMYRTREPWLGTALALVIGGAMGNIYDRVVHGAVMDFIDVHYLYYHWPAFNIADSAISVGVVILLGQALWPDRRSKADRDRDPRDGQGEEHETG